jgi:hypothetical protein
MVLGQELPVGSGTALASGDASASSFGGVPVSALEEAPASAAEEASSSSWRDSLTTVPPQDTVRMKIGSKEMTVRLMKPFVVMDGSPGSQT